MPVRWSGYDKSPDGIRSAVHRTLHPLYDVARLRAAFLALKKDAAPGADGDVAALTSRDWRRNSGTSRSYCSREGIERSRPALMVKRAFVQTAARTGKVFTDAPSRPSRTPRPSSTPSIYTRISRLMPTGAAQVLRNRLDMDPVPLEQQIGVRALADLVAGGMPSGRVAGAAEHFTASCSSVR